MTTPLTKAREALEEYDSTASKQRAVFGWETTFMAADALGNALRSVLAHAKEVERERDEARGEVKRERERTHRMSLACEWCRAKGYGESGGSPCPLHGGCESGAIGTDAAGKMFFYCPNCSQRTSDGTKHRYRAEAEVERLTLDLARLREVEKAARDFLPTIREVARGAHWSGGKEQMVSAMILDNALSSALSPLPTKEST